MTSSVTFTLRTDLFGSDVTGPITIDCGPDGVSGLTRNRQVIPTTAGAGWVNITSSTLQSSAGSGGCAGGGVLPYKETCTLDGSLPGAQLVIR